MIIAVVVVLKTTIAVFPVDTSPASQQTIKAAF